MQVWIFSLLYRKTSHCRRRVLRFVRCVENVGMSSWRDLRKIPFLAEILSRFGARARERTQPFFRIHALESTNARNPRAALLALMSALYAHVYVPKFMLTSYRPFLLRRSFLAGIFRFIFPPISFTRPRFFSFWLTRILNCAFLREIVVSFFFFSL